MPPKKPDARSERGQQKAAEREKQKAVDDRTFGLKNKNKSKSVQKYIKGIQQTAHQKGGDSAQINKEYQAREEKKKAQQQEALLASLFRSTESAKTAAEKERQKADPKQLRQDAKIDLYTDKRDAEEWDQAELEEVVASKHGAQAQASVTSIVCKHFLEAIEKRQYGWFWVCPNGGESCQYRHALPPGFVFESKKADEVDDDEEEELLEDIIERERAALPSGGTKVTKETFEVWKQQQIDKQKAAEEQRQAEAKKGGKPQVLSGRDLFSWNPSLFVDDDEAASEEEYEESEE
eukprot:Polyplicarium_translucidae@DN3321_c0_g1_i1.p1